jgi:rare lipoprotein A (peptidoglycan hydrolase)
MKTMMCAIFVSVILATVANAGINGYATWFTIRACQREGNTGITAGGRLLNESALWCALPSRPPRDGSGRRAWGRKIRITNLNTGKNIICEQWDFGPGKAAQARGVCIDLTPAAFLALGGNMKKGKIKVEVTIL